MTLTTLKRFADRKAKAEKVTNHRNGATQSRKSRNPIPRRKTSPFSTNSHRNERGATSSDRQRPPHSNWDPQRAAGEVPDGQGRSSYGAGLETGGYWGSHEILVSVLWKLKFFLN